MSPPRTPREPAPRSRSRARGASNRRARPSWPRCSAGTPIARSGPAARCPAAPPSSRACALRWPTTRSASSGCGGSPRARRPRPRSASRAGRRSRSSSQGSFSDPTEPRTDVLVGLSLDLPVFAHVGDQLRAARAQTSAERARLAADDARARGRAGGRRIGGGRRRPSGSPALERDVLPAQERAASLAEQAYREGARDLASALQAERDRAAVRARDRRMRGSTRRSRGSSCSSPPERTPVRGRLAIVTAAADRGARVQGRARGRAGRGAAPAAAVTCAPIATTPVDDVVEVNGVIAPPPKLDAVVSSPVAGRVAQVGVEEGDQVAAGALLATIEDPALPGREPSRPGPRSPRRRRPSTAAQQELARQQRLVETGIGARRDLDDARAKAAAAAAELDAANARAGLASRQHARRELRAPHAGVVLHVWKRVGESVDGTTATPVAEVADVAMLELRAQVPPAALVAAPRRAWRRRVQVIGDRGAAAGEGRARRAGGRSDDAARHGARRSSQGTRSDPGRQRRRPRRIVDRAAPGPGRSRRTRCGARWSAPTRSSSATGGVAHACAHGDRRHSADEATASRSSTGASRPAASRSCIDHVLGLEDGQPLDRADPQTRKPP